MIMDKNIKEKILLSLDEIERTENVKILHCAESGSRAWGFESPDSDYDVRFIYVRTVEDYLRLDDMRDVIEWELNDVYDINGWDLKKALILLHKSNCTLFEWNNSPIIYRTTPEWQRISAVIDSYFRDKLGMYHYLSTARHNYNAYFKSDKAKLKKYFYVLRPILACRHIIAEGTPPPMEFAVLKNKYLPAAVQQYVDELLRLKMNTPEIGMGRRIPELDSYIENSFEELNDIINNMESGRPAEWQELNTLFAEITESRK